MCAREIGCRYVPIILSKTCLLIHITSFFITRSIIIFSVVLLRFYPVTM
ncbi:Uncharacterized protein APZ42_003700, partial [Daphnia magna]